MQEVTEEIYGSYQNGKYPRIPLLIQVSANRFSGWCLYHAWLSNFMFLFRHNLFKLFNRFYVGHTLSHNFTFWPVILLQVIARVVAQWYVPAPTSEVLFSFSLSNSCHTVFSILACQREKYRLHLEGIYYPSLQQGTDVIGVVYWNNIHGTKCTWITDIFHWSCKMIIPYPKLPNVIHWIGWFWHRSQSYFRRGDNKTERFAVKTRCYQMESYIPHIFLLCLLSFRQIQALDAIDNPRQRSSFSMSKEFCKSKSVFFRFISKRPIPLLRQKPVMLLLHIHYYCFHLPSPKRGRRWSVPSWNCHLSYLYQCSPLIVCKPIEVIYQHIYISHFWGMRKVVKMWERVRICWVNIISK